jgi:hypothetical protein
MRGPRLSARKVLAKQSWLDIPSPLSIQLVRLFRHCTSTLRFIPSHASPAFLLAANVVMEIEGETSDIQSYFHTSTTSAGVSVGWGPFSIASPSVSHADKQARSSVEATATGCQSVFCAVRGGSLLTSEGCTFRITTKGPQIIVLLVDQETCELTPIPSLTCCSPNY